MEKARNKKIGVFAGVILLLVLGIVLAVLVIGKDNEEGKEGTAADKAGQEVIIGEEKEAEDGLDIAEPEDAEKNSASDSLDFIGTEDNGGSGVGSDNTGNGGNTGNLEEETEDDNVGYGDFF